MALSDYERSALRLLSERGDGMAVALETDAQVSFWRNMAERGYAKLKDHARCGFEMVRGDYVSLTEAGRDAIAPNNTGKET